MTEQSRYLVALARQIVQPYTALPSARGDGNRLGGQRAIRQLFGSGFDPLLCR